MPIPSIFGCLYSSTLDFLNEAFELLDGIGDLGTVYYGSVRGFIGGEPPVDPSCPGWKPKVVTNASQAPCAFTRDAVLTALSGGGCINFVRIGGISGFLAVAMGAYGAHAFAQDMPNGGGSGYGSESYRSSTKQTSSRRSRSTPGSRSTMAEDDEGGIDENKKEIYNIANQYHFIHSLALLATPVLKRPNLTGTLLTAGMLLFCGSCYVHVLTGNKEISKVTPYGGVLLIAAWISMIL